MSEERKLQTITVEAPWSFTGAPKVHSYSKPTAEDITAHLLEHPSMAWEVLTALAAKVAGPWHHIDWSEGTWVRDDGDGDGWWAEVGPDSEGYYWAAWDGEQRLHKLVDDNGARSIEDAKAAADKALTTAGFVLVAHKHLPTAPNNK